MLALGRKPGEYIMLGDDIKITVLEINGDLRLSIEAPREVRIMRGELYEKEHAQKAQ